MAGTGWQDGKIYVIDMDFYRVVLINNRVVGSWYAMNAMWR
jgi:hypothetical protein